MSEENPSIAIPKEFYSFSSGVMFDRCIECDQYLLHDDCEYFIEKAIKNYVGFTAQDVIFEYAICLKCAEKMRSAMSKKSMATLQQYLMENIDPIKRMALIEKYPNNPIAWMDECLLTGLEKSDLNEYQIYAHCKGNKLDTTQMPYLVSGKALEEIAELLSPETKDELDDFSKRHFGPPPEFENPSPIRKVILI